MVSSSSSNLETSRTHTQRDHNTKNKKQKKTTTAAKAQQQQQQQQASLTSGLDGGGDEGPMVAYLPQVDARHPPRIFTCRCYPLVRQAFTDRGYRATDGEHNYDNAWMIWKTGMDIDVQQLQHWQRPNHFPGERLMDSKGSMYQVLRMYHNRGVHRTTMPLDFVPETYLLYAESDKARFVQRLKGGGLDVPWVLKRTKASRGRGVTMLGPQSAELRALRDDLATGPIKKGHIVQSYIQNEWTFQGHKCDLRVYVLVASVEPLIVYYHDGIVRTAAGLHNEENFDESKAHLTNVSQNKANRTQWEPVKTFTQLGQELQSYVGKRRRQQPQQEHRQLPMEDVEKNPLQHVRNQIKRILGFVFAAFRDRISLEKIPVDNAFALMGADFVIDADLKVWLLEMQLGPQLQGDNLPEKIAILQDVLGTTIDVVEEVYLKQVNNQPIMPLTKTGNFELVYNEQDDVLSSTTSSL